MFQLYHLISFKGPIRSMVVRDLGVLSLQNSEAERLLYLDILAQMSVNVMDSSY